MQTDLSSSLRELLAHNIIRFTFRKVDGTIRHAVGTRNLSLARTATGEDIPTPKGEEQPNSYYDVEKNGWRSYRPELLISIDEVVAIRKEREIPIAKADTDFKPTHRLPVRDTDSERDPISGLIGAMFGGAPLHTADPVTPTTKRGELPKRDGSAPVIGTPVLTERGIELPVGAVSVEDFARMVAKYVADELATRLKG